VGLGLLLVLLSGLGRPSAALRAEDAAAIEARLADAARYLASEELEGRGLGSKGLDLAAEFIAARFADYRLKTDLYDGKPFQNFTVESAAQLGPDNRLTLIGPPPKEGAPPERIELPLGKDFNPLALSGSKQFELPLVFAGYGITAAKEGYDDYAGLDVKGKMVVVLRHEPQQDDANSVFAGKRDSAYAPLLQKVKTAAEHGAAGVVFCTEDFDIRKSYVEFRKKWQEALDRVVAEHEKFKQIKDPDREQVESHRAAVEKLLKQVEAWNKRLLEETDPVLPLSAGGPGRPQKDMPVVHCRRTVVERIVKAALGADLTQIEAQIDKDLKPHSAELAGWKAAGRVELKPVEARNVVAMLDGQGPTAEETVVLGAHYDHVGVGGPGAIGGRGKGIFPGADDNASGVAVMLEVARALAARPEKLPRRVVFIAFTGEETGLKGSNRYVQHPLIPLKQTVAMLNLDMVGRLRNDQLMVLGTGTSKLFEELADRVPAEGLKIAKLPVGAGPSDQLAFYSHNIPVLHFFTGVHSDYHRPSDTFETLNVPGMRRVAKYVEEVATAIASAPRPEFVATPARKMGLSSGNRPLFGSVPDFGSEGDGFRLAEVLEGGPAAKAGLKAGDVVVEFGGEKIGGLEEFTAALEKHKAGDKVKTVVRRGAETLSFEVTLDKPR
jgi:hypothetical protein